MDEVHEYMEALEKKTGKGFGDPAKPLLVSVRSGSALSMPGNDGHHPQPGAQ